MNSTESQLIQGWKIHQQRRWVDAEQIYRQVLAQAPTNPNAWCYLGICLHDQRRYPEAVDAYRRALSYQPQFPIALNNLGNSLRYIQAYDEADRCFQQALELKPDYLNAYKNRGTLHVWRGDLERGQKYYQHALEINPHEAELHRNLGVIYLLQGRFPEGWREYRWRWQVGDLQRPAVPAPIWEGQDLAGKSILLTAEQGLGDTLNFVRLATPLVAHGARPTVYCQAPLLALLQQTTQFGRIYPNSLPVEQSFDFQCSLLDLADISNLNSQTIPANVPYLAPAPNLLAYWRQRLPKPHRVVRVGIAWQGNPEHQADAFRSVPLAHFESLAGIPGVELISLQSGYGTEQIAQWQGERPLRIVDAQLDQSSGAFMDTAAIMQTLDVVITSDTAIAHLAGALGLPTWIALGYVPDWRWLLGRDDSPWYPTVTLFRQPSMGDWSSVFAKLTDSLSDFTARASNRP
jgi:tetratricopeptide (TPR) repeat protein